MSSSITDNDALLYHSMGKKGKIEVVATKPCRTQRDLSLAYTPGVAVPCLEIAKDPSKVFEYTAKGNLVAVISDGTAVLGLGDIGPAASKPVMEGKGVLFKRFAGIDVFDIELNTKDPDEIIKTVQLLEPTFGGINLEDISGPNCFYIEDKLKETMNIPVFHDDQHGTAIISGAALINALEINGKKIQDLRVVINGAGAAGIACAKHYVTLGCDPKNLILCDSKGIIHKDRDEKMNRYKAEFAVETNLRTLEEAMVGADLFLGCSVANTLSQKMVKSMADHPIIFAMANPNPEITYPDALAARDDVIMATGRSDYPNQVNNVLGFPFIFRGALDTRATTINEEMKMAATIALAKLAKEDVPDSVCRAYGVKRLSFGKEYLIPKPFDYRVLIWEASAVAKAAIESGVARKELNIEEYKEHLESLLGNSRKVMRVVKHMAQEHPKKIVLPEGEDERILRAAALIVEENIGQPILLGTKEVISKKAEDLGISLEKMSVVNPVKSEKYDDYAKEYWEIRQRHGRTLSEAYDLMKLPRVFGPMMVKKGDADTVLSGITMSYAETIRPAIRAIGVDKKYNIVASMYMMVFDEKVLFFADSTVNIDPSAEELASIAMMTADNVKKLGFEPKIAMLSFSDFGSAKHASSIKVKKATEIVKEKRPDLAIDGEMQADVAVDSEARNELYPFSTLVGDANILIFPDLQSANISYKLLKKLGKAEAIGPILMGLNKSAHIISHEADVEGIVNMAAIAVRETD
ncbi:MAG: NADP-dependent malic enzyme [Pseudomonadota bacterium]